MMSSMVMSTFVSFVEGIEGSMFAVVFLVVSVVEEFLIMAELFLVVKVVESLERKLVL